MAQREPGTRPEGRANLVMAMLALCGVIVSLQQTMVVPVLPEFPTLLDISVDDASWLVTATLLTGAVSTPVVTRLADMYGKRRMIVVALSVMVAGSILGAVAHEHFAAVILARVLQGVGMALVPVGMAMMRDVLPAARVPLGVSLMSGTLAIGAGAGLPLAGLLVDRFAWHSIFWATALVGAALLVGAVRILPESPLATGGRFDLGGAVVLSAGLSLVLLSISKGGQWGWGAPITLGTAAGGAALLALWVPMTLRAPHPLIDIRAASRPAVALVNICAVFTGFGMFANMLITTQRLQLPTADGLGLTTLESGLWLAPGALVFGFMAPVAAAMIRRFGAELTLALGGGMMGVAYALRTFFDSTLFEVVAGSIVVSAGTSLAFAAMPVLIMAMAPVTETASANGLNTLLRALGTSSSSAILAAVGAASTVVVAGVPYPSGDALVTVLWISAAASGAALLVALALLPMRPGGAPGRSITS
jgi:MFS family permease